MKVNIALIKNIFLENNISFSTNLNDEDLLTSISSINEANSNSLIFLFNEKYLNSILKSKAKCCVLKKEHLSYLPTKIKYLRTTFVCILRSGRLHRQS